MKVLIGIISKNRAKILPIAINSALEQDYIDKAISIFDDNSTDNTRELVAEFSQVDWHISTENRGYVYGRNKLMSESTAEYYCSLDDDSWFIKKDGLSIACKYLDEHPDVAAIAYDILSPDKPIEKPLTNPIETNLFIGCGHVLRLSAVKEVGYYFKFPGFYAGEERDLCIRLIDKGYKIVKLPGVHIWHDKTMVSRNLSMQCISNVCNDLSYAFIRFPLFKMIVAIPYKIFLHIIVGVRTNNLVPYLKGITKFLFFLFLLRLKRNAVSKDGFNKFKKLY